MKVEKNSSGFRLRNDVILVVSLLIVAAAALVYLFNFRKEGDVVKVMVDGEIFGVYSLSQDITEEICTGGNGENINRFEIKDGKANMLEASCPDGICVAHRPVFRDGESIVCLPNRVVVTVVSQDDMDAPDIVA